MVLWVFLSVSCWGLLFFHLFRTGIYINISWGRSNRNNYSGLFQFLLSTIFKKNQLTLLLKGNPANLPFVTARAVFVTFFFYSFYRKISTPFHLCKKSFQKSKDSFCFCLLSFSFLFVEWSTRQEVLKMSQSYGFQREVSRREWVVFCSFLFEVIKCSFSFFLLSETLKKKKKKSSAALYLVFFLLFFLTFFL